MFYDLCVILTVLHGPTEFLVIMLFLFWSSELVQFDLHQWLAKNDTKLLLNLFVPIIINNLAIVIIILILSFWITRQN